MYKLVPLTVSTIQLKRDVLCNASSYPVSLIIEQSRWSRVEFIRFYLYRGHVFTYISLSVKFKFFVFYFFSFAITCSVFVHLRIPLCISFCLWIFVFVSFRREIKNLKNFIFRWWLVDTSRFICSIFAIHVHKYISSLISRLDRKNNILSIDE